MFLNNEANDAVNNARAQALNAERGRQQAFDAEAKGVTDQSLGRYANFDQQMGADKDRLKTLFTTPTPGVSTPGYNAAALPAPGSDLVQREVNNKQALAHAYGIDQADKLAQLRSFGDVMGNIGRGVADDTGRVGQIGSFKKGSEAATQYELDSANRAGNTYKFFGDLLGGAGKVALTAGLSPQLASAAPAINANGTIAGAFGPTSVGGAPLVGASNVFSSGTSPFLSYGV
ncbi:hypothetical protein ACRQ5Q_24255 [Bradyrhizobium sp. PMVTL-01]|uniref:hypothetical protein n=1 Tax=Bradyrhizobium sp. PMVTL-01 TaxID=3434999 RepID=UPI003F726A35